MKYLRTILAFVAMLMLVVVVPSRSYAAVYDGRGGQGACSGSTRSYFNNQCYAWDSGYYQGDGFVLPHYQYNHDYLALQPVWDQRFNGSNAMRDALINLLGQYRNGWGNMKTATGAAFIIQTMLGRDGDQANANGGRNISDADWNEVVTRLNQSTLVVSNTYIGPPDTGGDYPYDVDFTWTNAAPSGNYLYIQQNGQTKYVLDFGCANPIGGLSGLDRVIQWSTGGWSQVGVDHDPNVTSWTATPGNNLYWRHGVYNNGPDTTGNIAFAINKSGFSNGWNGVINPQGSFNLASGQTQQIGYQRAWSDYSAYTVTQDDVGNTLCEAVSWGPRAWNDGSWTNSGGACVNIPYSFNLTPSINGVGMTDAVEPGTPIGPIRANINNSGPTKSYDGTNWQLSKFIIAPGGAVPTGADGQGTPCSYYGKGCSSVATGSGTFMPGDTQVNQIDSYTVEDMPLGSRVCFALATTGYNKSNKPNSGWWRYGVPVCVMVGKKPKVQVWGGDVATRAGINVSLTQKSNGAFGSWVEYGSFSVQSNKQLASGSGLSSSPSPQGSSQQVAWSKLTFANVDNNGNAQFGQYGTATGFRPLPDIAQYFSAISNQAPFSGNQVSANSFATGSAVQVRTAGDLTLHKDTLPLGRSVVIVASGTVTIDGDISYAGGSLKALTDIPQLVIIAKNINITNGASNIDAWLVTSDQQNGTINTCSNGPVQLTGNDCNNQLTVHGPVAAGQLLLRRTAGSGTGNNSGDPAEVFDLRADTYLWAQLIASGGGKAQTVYTVELPPRF